MEIYKTYLRENSSTVMIEHYPLESLPQILNHANDMDFVWIDVDAIQRFQQEDVDDVLSTLPLCSPYGIHYVMDGEGLTVTQLAALSNRRLSPDRIRALINIGLLDTYQVVLKVRGPDGKEREIMMEWTSLNPGVFYAQRSPKVDTLRHKTRLYYAAIGERYQNRKKKTISLDLLPKIHTELNIICRYPDEPDILKAGVVIENMTHFSDDSYLRYVPIYTGNQNCPVFWCNIVDPRLCYAGHSLEAVMAVGGYR